MDGKLTMQWMGYKFEFELEKAFLMHECNAEKIICKTDSKMLLQMVNVNIRTQTYRNFIKCTEYENSSIFIIILKSTIGLFSLDLNEMFK